jgi:hypothetical protein
MNTVPASAPEAPSGIQGRPITCRVDELRPHPSFVRHRIAVPASQLSPLAERVDLVFREPLLITRDRTILDGYARWGLARQQGRLTLPCLEYDLPEAEALHWLLQKHRRSNGLNPFSRILLALELESWLREQARSNQQAGGQNRGSSKLSEADRLDVRARIAAAAGASAGNVSKVKHLLSAAQPELLQALREGEVSIHRASLWLLAPATQLDQFWRHQNLRGIARTINTLLRAIDSPTPQAKDNSTFNGSEARWRQWLPSEGLPSWLARFRFPARSCCSPPCSCRLWMVLAEGHLMRTRFAAMLRRIALLPLPAS